ncbi:MAG TPA: N-acetylmuramoyl-L-alanine amidase [Terriglobales bacterium]|nr:N-acetylmuramoyl-L-alanine amidase [Terriglobales bacterium]
MESVEETKLRILREAIQSNVGEARGTAKPKLPVQLKRTFSLWLWGSLLIASGTYLAVPSLVVSRGQGASSNAASVDTTQSTERKGAGMRTTVPLPVPHRLSRAVIPLRVERVVIDPGHGGKQHGAISESGVSEKDITLDIALRLRRLMENGPVTALMTREADKTLSLEKRVSFANANRADLFVSIHVNWMEPREIRPLETYYVGATNDPAIIKLASIENRDSGYSLADYRRLLDKIYLDTRREESQRLATVINSELYQSLSQINPELENRGVKMAPFAVLIGTQMPAILAEVSCLSNEDDVKLLTNADYREKIAQALLRGILSYANNLNGSEKVAELWKKPTKHSASE